MSVAPETLLESQTRVESPNFKSSIFDFFKLSTSYIFGFFKLRLLEICAPDGSKC
jgi:hypothetical protein